MMCVSERRVILINTCSTAARAYSNAHFGQGSVATIWLDDVRCSGLEAQLLDCPAQPLGTHNCGHNEDAGVSCGTSQGTTNCTYSLGHIPSIAFRISFRKYASMQWMSLCIYTFTKWIWLRSLQDNSSPLHPETVCSWHSIYICLLFHVLRAISRRRQSTSGERVSPTRGTGGSVGQRKVGHCL